MRKRYCPESIKKLSVWYYYGQSSARSVNMYPSCFMECGYNTQKAVPVALVRERVEKLSYFYPVGKYRRQDNKDTDMN